MPTLHNVFQKTRWGAHSLFKASRTSVTTQETGIQDGRDWHLQWAQMGSTEFYKQVGLISGSKLALSFKISVICHHKEIK